MLEVIDCFMDDGSPGAKMMQAMPKSACDPTMQGPVIQCVVKEAKVHPTMLAKVMSKLGHLGKLCNQVAVRLKKIYLFKKLIKKSKLNNSELGFLLGRYSRSGKSCEYCLR